MSLHFVIDGYNITNHPQFVRIIKGAKDQRSALLVFLKSKKIFLKNKVTVIFDGFCDFRFTTENPNISLLYSQDESADDLIRRIVEQAKDPRNIIVVSDDKEVRISSRLNRAKVLKVEEFLAQGKARPSKDTEPRDLGLTSSQARAINEELKRLWLE
jgi:predicted RNA-binding protein with PIN domain